MMNLALTNQFGISRIQVPPGSMQSVKPQRRSNLPRAAERLLWVPAAILALGALKKYVALATEEGRLPEVAAQHHPDLLTRIREAGW